MTWHRVESASERAARKAAEPQVVLKMVDGLGRTRSQTWSDGRVDHFNYGDPPSPLARIGRWLRRIGATA